MKNTLVAQIKEILEDLETCRDDDGSLSMNYFIRFYDVMNTYAYNLERYLCSGIPCRIPQIRRYLQNNHPELRGEKWHERQKYSNKIKQKLRNQEKPEEIFS